MTVWIIWIDLVAWIYWILIVWSDGHGAVLQVHLVVLDHVSVIVEDNVLATGIVRYKFVALVFVVLDA